MNKPFTHWDQDELRKAMSASVPPCSRAKPTSNTKRPSYPTKPVLDLIKAMGRINHRQLAVAMDMPLGAASSKLQNMKHKGQIRRLTKPKEKPAIYGPIE